MIVLLVFNVKHLHLLLRFLLRHIRLWSDRKGFVALLNYNFDNRFRRLNILRRIVWWFMDEIRTVRIEIFHQSIVIEIVLGEWWRCKWIGGIKWIVVFGGVRYSFRYWWLAIVKIKITTKVRVQTSAELINSSFVSGFLFRCFCCIFCFWGWCGGCWYC